MRRFVCVAIWLASAFALGIVIGVILIMMPEQQFPTVPR